MSQFKTSVTICSYNMGHLVFDAIRSVLSQTQTDWELLLLDDGSTDQTLKVFHSFEKDPRIRILQNGQRQGLTFCRNRLLQESRGEFISVLDADDLLLPDKIRQHERILTLDKNIGMVWGQACLLNQVSHELSVLPPSHYRQGWDLTESYEAVHSATTWRRSVLIEVGGYDPRFTLVEDADIYLKVGDKYEQRYVPGLVAIKRLFPNNEFRMNSMHTVKELGKEIYKNTLRRRQLGEF